MHVIFIPYGIKQEVDHFLMDLQAQKFQIPMTDPQGNKQVIWMQGSLRILPFGIYDYVFPKENMDIVLTTLKFNRQKGYDGNDRYNLGAFRFWAIRKFLKVEKIPKFKTDKKLLWYMDFTEILPIGIKYDADKTETEGKYKGWTFEAI